MRDPNMPCLYKDGDPIHEKAKDDEPLFTLRAQDITAPAVVEFWARLNDDLGAPKEKTDHARLHAKAMRDWPGHKKIPD